MKIKTKYKGHQSFPVREGWLYKGLRYVMTGEKYPERPFRDTNEDMKVLGLGSNMVSSLKYWMQALHLIAFRKNCWELTEFGQLLAEKDIHFLDTGSLAFCHYELVTNKEFATSWYAFFNVFEPREFHAEDFVRFVLETAEDKPAEASVKSDIDCLLNMYVTDNSVRYDEQGNVDFESNRTSPFTRLGLLMKSPSGRNMFEKIPVNMNLLPNNVAMYAIAKQQEALGKAELQFSELLRGENSVGRIFNLTDYSLDLLLDKLAQKHEIRFVRTAGLDSVQVLDHHSPDEIRARYYGGR